MALHDTLASGAAPRKAKSEFADNWGVLAAATVGCGLGASSLPFYSFGTFIVPLTHQFGWTRGQMSAALVFMTLALAISSPVLGAAIDRFGVRRLGLIACPLLGLVFFALSGSTGSLPLFYASFAAISLFAGGTTPINYTRAVNEAFSAARGLALGIALAGLGLAAMVLPIFSSLVVTHLGWRAAYGAIGLLALCAWPALYLGLRGSPPRAQGWKSSSIGFTFLRSRTFWTLAFCCFFVSAAFAGLVVHITPLLRDAGLSAGNAALYAALIGFGGIVGRLTVGVLVDRLFAPWVAAATFAASALGCVLLVTQGVAAAPIAIAIIGFSFGAEVDIISYLVARYFGMARYGVIYGVIYSCFAVGAAFGPLVGGAVFDATHSYANALWGAAAILAAGAAGFITLPRFPHRSREAAVADISVVSAS